jgi:hypothetical protein
VVSARLAQFLIAPSVALLFLLALAVLLGIHSTAEYANFVMFQDVLFVMALIIVKIAAITQFILM